MSHEKKPYFLLWQEGSSLFIILIWCSCCWRISSQIALWWWWCQSFVQFRIRKLRRSRHVKLRRASSGFVVWQWLDVEFSLYWTGCSLDWRWRTSYTDVVIFQSWLTDVRSWINEYLTKTNFIVIISFKQLIGRAKLEYLLLQYLMMSVKEILEMAIF